MIPTNKNLRLTISREPQPDTYRTVLTLQESGEMLAEEVVDDFDASRLYTEHVRPLYSYATQEIAPGRLKALGRELARALLPVGVRYKLLTLFWQSPETPTRLFIQTPPELAALPWEFVCIEDESQANNPTDFLCQRPHLYLIRQQGLPRTPTPVTERPIRVLLAWADPATASYPRLPHLHAEIAAIRTALRPEERPLFHLKIVEHASASSLSRALREYQPHILHFLGHGDTRPSGSALILEDGGAGTGELYGDDLAAWLRATPCRLVMLSACHTATSENSVVATLAAQGIDAVIGMQLPMRSAASVPFAQVFYSALAEQGNIESALALARPALGMDGPGWGMPTLHLSGTTGHLFTFAPLPPPPLPPPFHVPYRHNHHFMGREAELDALRQQMQAMEGQPVALVGMGGMGKTQLAVEYAHRCRSEYPGGIFWIQARDTARIKEEYAALSLNYGARETDTMEQRARQMLDALQARAQPTLVIFDNVTEEAGLEWFPTAQACHILATAREEHLFGQDFHKQPVQRLNPVDARELLLKTGRKPADEGEEAAIDDIVDCVGGLPLALALIGHYVQYRNVSYQDYLAGLKARPQEALSRARQRFMAATRHDGSIFDTLELSFRKLTPTALAALSAAACFAGRAISPNLLRQVVVTDNSENTSAGLENHWQSGGQNHWEDDFEDAVAELKDFCLVTRETDNRLTLHELVRVFALGRMEGAERNWNLDRTAQVLTICLHQANEAMHWQKVRPELNHCRTLADLCRQYRATHNLPALLREMGGYYGAHAEFRLAIECCRESIRLLEERGGRRQPDVAFLLMQIGDLHYGLRLNTEALTYQREALEIAEATMSPDDPRLLNHYWSIGVVAKKLEKYEDAAWYQYKALAICERLYGARHAQVAFSRNNIGTLLEAQGELEQALIHLEAALDIDTELLGAEHPSVAVHMNNIGRVLKTQGCLKPSLKHHQEALRINQNSYGDCHPDVAASLFYCGEALFALGQVAEARQHYTDALRIYEHFFGSEHFFCQETRKRLQACSK